MQWAGAQSGLTGVVIIGMGLIAGLQGFRFARLLTVVSCALIGFAAGEALGPASSSSLPGLVGSVAGAVLGLLWPTAALAATNGVLGTVVLSYLTEQLGVTGTTKLVLLGTAAVACVALTLVSRRAMVVAGTSLFGAGLVVLGLIILAGEPAPAVADTLRGWVRSGSVMVPVLVMMLAVTLYSYQVNASTGSIVAGRSAGQPRHAPGAARGEPRERRPTA